MNIIDELDFRTSFAKEHSKQRLSDSEAACLVMREDPDFYQRWSHWQRFKMDHGPTLVRKHRPVTYETIMNEVDAAVRKSVGSTRQEAFVTLLQAHEGQPDEQVYSEAYRHYVLHDQPDELAQAAIDATPLTRLTPAQIQQMVKAMPPPPTRPTMDFMRTR